jgi:hypothetical protein
MLGEAVTPRRQHISTSLRSIPSVKSRDALGDCSARNLANVENAGASALVKTFAFSKW